MTKHDSTWSVQQARGMNLHSSQHGFYEIFRTDTTSPFQEHSRLRWQSRGAFATGILLVVNRHRSQMQCIRVVPHTL